MSGVDDVEESDEQEDREAEMNEMFNESILNVDSGRAGRHSIQSQKTLEFSSQSDADTDTSNTTDSGKI